MTWSAEERAWYREQSVFSDPGELGAWVDDLPPDPDALARIVRGLVAHRREDGPAGGFALPAAHVRADAEARYVEEILRVLRERDPATAAAPRADADRFVGVCRDFALLHCALLRRAGFPARVRVGFVDWFGPAGEFADHVVTEYLCPRRERPVLVDAELADPARVAAHGLDFDPFDVPRERFLGASEAWRLIRSGAADARRFGLRTPEVELVGAWFVAGNVRLELAALNRAETLLWDVWGVGADDDASLTEEDRAVFDRAAEVVVGGDLARIRAHYAGEEGLRLPREVLSLTAFDGARRVVLR
ncbi:transglutaminase-like domain-containing protein (plasmid) [Streptomyces sp. BI20]|uniref:transglutaminase-like domain-containing protein n=1 Tax=Streptomyces sp. BI20 TaxID=3403460 RepID=UPI003C7434DB